VRLNNQLEKPPELTDCTSFSKYFVVPPITTKIQLKMASTNVRQQKPRRPEFGYSGSNAGYAYIANWRCRITLITPNNMIPECFVVQRMIFVL